MGFSIRVLHSHGVVGLAAVALAAGCRGGAESPKPESGVDEPTASVVAEPAVEVEAATTPPKLDESMKGHFDQVTQIKDAVIDGDLEAVAAPATWLTDELSPPGLPMDWRPYASALQVSAAEAKAAGDLIAAGKAAGELVSTCGACHEAVGNGPRFGTPLPIPEGEDTTARMQRHQWAADRMWEAMIARSDDRWKAGAGAVSNAPPEPCPIPDEAALPREALDLREKIYDLGAKAAAAEDWDSRAQIYGEYLTTCAGCHVGGC